MRKIQKILLGMFAGGVLLTGIGTGIAFIEYSTLSYGGQKVIGEENLVTKTFTYELEESDQEVILERSYTSYADLVTEVMEDDEVPEGAIQYEVTYNEKRVRPYIQSEESYKSANDKEGTVLLRLGFTYFGDGFEEFMENKDVILNDLKNHTISAYDTSYVTKVVIKAHPDTMEIIHKGYF